MINPQSREQLETILEEHLKGQIGMSDSEGNEYYVTTYDNDQKFFNALIGLNLETINTIIINEISFFCKPAADYLIF